MKAYDAIVVGSGPNGLAAAITLARKGLSVLILERHASPGGGVRSAELTLPGFVHDICSTIYPMAIASPFLRTLPLHEHGLRWIEPPVPLAHPLPDGTVAILDRAIPLAAFMKAWVERADELIADLLGPLRLPKHLLLAFLFGIRALLPAKMLARIAFHGDASQALWAGLAAHSVLPLEKIASSAAPLLLAIAGHAYGWPLVRGGSQNLTQALVACFKSLGGEIILGIHVKSLRDIPPARVVLFDLTPQQIAHMEDLPLSSFYRRRLLRYRYGPAVFKVDWALSRAIPWRSAACARAGTVHLGGYLRDIARAEADAWKGKITPKPFVLLTQPSLFDPSRSPPGMHTAWAYCHVPHGSAIDYTASIEAQIETYAPGFQDCILARHVMGPKELELHNPNYIGGDIVGGVADLWQLFTRPVARLDPYRLAASYFICSASSPPGGGVHGLSGYFAALSALKHLSK